MGKFIMLVDTNLNLFQQANMLQSRVAVDLIKVS